MVKSPPRPSRRALCRTVIALLGCIIAARPRDLFAQDTDAERRRLEREGNRRLEERQERREDRARENERRERRDDSFRERETERREWLRRQTTPPPPNEPLPPHR